MKKKYAHIACAISLSAVLCIPISIHAQSARKIERRANASFQNKDYYNAAKLYSAILYDSPLVKKTSGLVYPFQSGNHTRTGKIRQSERSDIVYQLAESYRLYNQYKEALPQYEQYLLSRDARFPLARLWYGICLLANDETEKAITAFNTFLQNYKTENTFAQKARLGIATCNFSIINKSLPPRAMITKFQPAVSADGSNFAMEKINDSSFWFTTSRHEINKIKEKVYPISLYSGNFNRKSVEKMAGFPANDMNRGASSLSADGLTLYFTGWKDDAKSLPTHYHIFYTTRASIDSKWNTPIAMPGPVNIVGFNSKQPFITRDNKYLLFVSDQPGGYGKYDIWMVNMDGRQPAGTAFNPGRNVNTDAEEASPFYDAESGYLYFSSDGKTGMGGMDIYKISGKFMSNQWPEPATNLGFPLNSVRDDLYYTKESHSDVAYLSSDRASTCCMELFKAVHLPYTDTSGRSANNKNLPVPANKPVNNKPTDSITEESMGNRHLMDSINAITIGRKYVNYNFASARIRKADYSQLNNVIQLMEHNPALNILVASFTDCIGSKSANVLLSGKRSESVKAYLIKKGIDPSRINIDFFGKKHFIIACKEDSSYNKEKQIANRRSDLIVTNEQNPKWEPSGKELDIPEIPSGSSSLSINNNTDDKNKYDNSMQETGYGKILRERDGADNSKRSGNNARKRRNAAGNIKREDSVVNSKRKVMEVKNVQQNHSPKIAKVLPESSEKPVAHMMVDSMRNKLKITELLDISPRLKTPDVIEEMTRRIPRKSFMVYATSDSVRIELYDNGVFDYDSVSVVYNKQLVVYKQLLQTNKPISFYVKLDPDQRKNEMIFFADNLGLTPPNSALMIITDGDNKRTEVNVSSDLEHNAVIYFIKVKK